MPPAKPGLEGWPKAPSPFEARRQQRGLRHLRVDGYPRQTVVMRRGSSARSSVLLALVFLFEAWLWEHLRPLVAWLVDLMTPGTS